MKKTFKKPVVGDIVEIQLDNNKKETGMILESFDPGVVLFKLSNGHSPGDEGSGMDRGI